MSVLLRNLIHFGELLRALDLDVPAGRMLDVAAALDHVEIGRRTDFYFTLQSLLVHRRQDLATFDEAFRMFWRRLPSEWSPHDLRAMGEQRRIGPPERETPTVGSGSGRPSSSQLQPVERIAPLSYSDREVLRKKDFAQFTADEMAEAESMMVGSPGSPTAGGPDAGRRRQAVRLTSGGWCAATSATGASPSWCRLASAVGPTAGWSSSATSAARWSGTRACFSTSRIVLRIGADSKCFSFATRLTRVTREIASRGADQAVTQVVKRIADWGGGTRIGDAIRTFNVEWARRVSGHGPVVLLISDGWDRGDPDRLAREMARLARGCYRLIWLNPLLGSPRYQPVTRGMAAALPFVDDFLPVHNMISLEALAAHLNTLSSNRLPRSRRPKVRVSVQSDGGSL